MRIGDVSRHRRFADPARQRWYAYHRTVRFALRMGQVQVSLRASAPGKFAPRGPEAVCCLPFSSRGPDFPPRTPA